MGTSNLQPVDQKHRSQPGLSRASEGCVRVCLLGYGPAGPSPSPVGSDAVSR